MSETEIAKIRRFLADKEMSDAIYSILFTQFLQRRKDADVHTLAAQTLAFQSLEDAWREMERYKQDKKQDAERRNIGI